jgi:hypothetical protein
MKRGLDSDCELAQSRICYAVHCSSFQGDGLSSVFREKYSLGETYILY